MAGGARTKHVGVLVNGWSDINNYCSPLLECAIGKWMQVLGRSGHLPVSVVLRSPIIRCYMVLISVENTSQEEWPHWRDTKPLEPWKIQFQYVNITKDKCRRMLVTSVCMSTNHTDASSLHHPTKAFHSLKSTVRETSQQERFIHKHKVKWIFDLIPPLFLSISFP